MHGHLGASATSYSFRRLLDQPGEDSQNYETYVLSDFRYEGLVRFLRENLEDSPRLRALDIGCGAGVISRGLASEFDQVTGVDGNPDNVALAQSITTDAGISNVSYQYADATRLPVEDESRDLIVLNGVLEWVGMNQNGEHPRARQLQTLKEVRRALRPRGLLYLAIENRWHPRTILKDPHSLLPMVNGLPRVLANRLSMGMTGRPFQTYIYGWRSLRRLLSQAGFAGTDLFVPFPGYQYPISYIAARPRARTLRDIARIDVPKVKNVLKEAGRPMDVEEAVNTMRRRAERGLIPLLSHDLVFLCRK